MSLKQRYFAWYDTYIVKGFYRTWVVWASALAVVGPELLQLLIDNFDLAAQALPFFDDGTKAAIRLAALVAIPVIRAIKQKSLAVEPVKVDPWGKL